MENPKNSEYVCSKGDFKTEDQAQGARHANATTGHLVTRQEVVTPAS